MDNEIHCNLQLGALVVSGSDNGMKLSEREQAVSMLAEYAGRIKSTIFAEAQSKFFQLIFLKEVKDKKEYREKLGMTWEQFCESLGMNRRTVDVQLQDIKAFKTEFLAAFAKILDTDFNKIKYLGEEVLAGSCQLQDNAIVYQGEQIPLTPDHKEDIVALLDRLEESYKSQLSEKDSALVAKERIIQDKAKHIGKQEKEIERLEKQAAEYAPKDSEEFKRKMGEIKGIFSGLMGQLDSYGKINRAEIAASNIKRVEYLGVFEYMKKMIAVEFDEQVNRFGNLSMYPELGIDQN